MARVQRGGMVGCSGRFDEVGWSGAYLLCLRCGNRLLPGKRREGAGARLADAEVDYCSARRSRTERGAWLHDDFRPALSYRGACRCRHVKLWRGSAQRLARRLPGLDDCRHRAARVPRFHVGRAEPARAMGARAARSGRDRQAIHQTRPPARASGQSGIDRQPNAASRHERAAGTGLSGGAARDGDVAVAQKNSLPDPRRAGYRAARRGRIPRTRAASPNGSSRRKTHASLQARRGAILHQWRNWSGSPNCSRCR